MTIPKFKDVHLKEIFADKLFQHPKALNQMEAELRTKLAKNLETSQVYQPLLVRPLEEGFEVLDGWSRKLSLDSMGVQAIRCNVIDVDDEEAELLLASLNSLRGTENPYQRAVLLKQLKERMSLKALSEILPESQAQLEDLLKLVEASKKAKDKAIKDLLNKSRGQQPVQLSFVMRKEEADLVNSAIAQFQPEEDPNPSKGLIALAESIMKKEDTQDV